jgi:hypothetical protein
MSVEVEESRGDGSGRVSVKNVGKELTMRERVKGERVLAEGVSKEAMVPVREGEGRVRIRRLEVVADTMFPKESPMDDADHVLWDLLICMTSFVLNVIHVWLLNDTR